MIFLWKEENTRIIDPFSLGQNSWVSMKSLYALCSDYPRVQYNGF